MSKSPKKTATAKASITKERIVQAAIDVFSELPVNLASVQMIANMARVKVPLLIYHFQTKENLYQIVLDRIYEASLQRVAPIVERMQANEPPEPPEAIKILCELICGMVDGFCHTLPAVNWKGRIVFQEYLYPSNSYELFFEKNTRPFYEMWAKIIMAVTGNPDRKTAFFQATAIFGQIAGFSIQREQLKRNLAIDDFSDQDLDTIKQLVIDNALFMLGAAPEKASVGR